MLDESRNLTSNCESQNDDSFEKELLLRLEQQTFKSYILQQLQETENLSATINDILSDIGAFVDASSITVFENSIDFRYVSNTFEWCGAGVESMMANYQNIDYENFPISKRHFDRHKTICANSPNELPEDIRNVFPPYPNAAILFIELECGRRVIGFININRYTGQKWTEDEVSFLRTTAHIVATALFRHHLEIELDEYKNNLEFIVRDRTEEIETLNEELKVNNEELYELTERLEEEIQYKDEMREQLEQSELVLKNFVKQIDEGIGIASRDGKILHWNRCLENILEISASEVLGHPFEEIKDRLIAMRTDTRGGVVSKIITGGVASPHYESVVMQMPSGAIKHCTVRIFPIKVGDFFITGVCVTDITEKYKRDAELELYRTHLEDEVKTRSRRLYDSEAKFRTMVQQLSDLIVIVDTEGVIRYISPACNRILGRTPEEMVNRNVFEFIHPSDIKYAAKELEHTKDENIPDDNLPATVSFRLIHANGESVIVEGIGRNGTTNEAIDGIILTFKDVTQQRLAEERIQENMHRQELTGKILQEFHYTENLDSSLTNVVNWIADFVPVCHLSLCCWTPVTFDNFKRYRWQDKRIPANGMALPETAPAKLLALWAESITGQLRLDYSFDSLPAFIQPYYTREIAYQMFVFPLIYGEGANGILILTRCILKPEKLTWEYSEASFMQSVARIIANALEKDLTQKSLVIAKERAEESDNLKSAFLANMSHEIRTPMNGILGFASLMQLEDEISPTMAQYAQIINDNSLMLLQLLDDIIDISKLESKQVKIVLTANSVKSLFTELLKLFNQLISDKKKSDVEIILDEASPDLNVMIDAVRLKQVLTNLVSNAIKFTEQGTVKFGFREDYKNHLLFYVKDTGIGIPLKYRDVIFERFRQVEEQKPNNIGGTGLGLAISKNLVEMMGGQIWVESEPGAGSTFYFTIKAEKV